MVVGTSGRRAGRGGGAFAVDAQAFGFRRVAQALVGTALIGDQQGEGAFVVGAWQVDVEDAMVDLDVTEELVVLGLALRQLDAAQFDVGGLGAELEAVAIQVIAFAGNETQLDRLGVALDQVELEGFAHRQEIGAVVQGRSAQRGAGAAVEQAGSRCGQGKGQQQEAKQTTHDGLAGRKFPHDSRLGDLPCC